MSDNDYDRGYEAGKEAGRDLGYERGRDDGYHYGVEEYRDRYYEAAHVYDNIAAAWNSLVAWLNVHYPNAIDEFEKSTAVAERMEKT